MNTTEKLGALIEFGMSQHDIKRATGVSQASISRILSGLQADLKLSTVEAIDGLYRKEKRKHPKYKVAAGVEE